MLLAVPHIEQIHCSVLDPGRLTEWCTVRSWQVGQSRQAESGIVGGSVMFASGVGDGRFWRRERLIYIRSSSQATMPGTSTQGIKTVLHPVSDLAAARAVYAALLGTAPQADSAYYVGFDVEGQHIGLVPGGPQGMASPVAYWHVDDIEAKLAEVTAAGATIKEPPRDVGGGRLVATIADPDGNVLGLLQDPR